MYNNIFSITVEEVAPEELHRMELYHHNVEWFSAHWNQIGDDCRGKVVAVSEGEFFVAADRVEAERLALEKHPNDVPFAMYVPLKKMARIYSNRISCEVTTPDAG